jgi:hypothetical protein
MTRKPFMLLAHSSWGHFGKAAIILLSISMVFTLYANPAQQVASQELEGKQGAEIAGVKFATPEGFKLEQSSDTRVAFMRHATSQIALFVAVPDHQVNDKYLIDLSNNLVSRLFPQQNGFAWKLFQRTPDRRVSMYQTSGGTTKGLNAKTFVQTDYLVVKVQRRQVVVGSIATFGEERNAKFLFEVEGREYSVTGWQALFHLIASVTGEETMIRNQGKGTGRLPRGGWWR